MRRAAWLPVLGLTLLALPAAPATAQVAVVTHHNNIHRTGVNDLETKLTTSNVNHLRRLFAFTLDDLSPLGGSQVVAQPLVLPQVPIPNATGGTRMLTVLYVATMHNTVFAFNADAPTQEPPLWARWFGQPVADLPGLDAKDIHGTNPEWGILSTPVIDPQTRVMYVVSWDAINGGTYRLHALDIATGNEKSGSPMTISATFTAVGANGASKTITFEPVYQKQRPGLLLLKPSDITGSNPGRVGPNGSVYVAFGASIEDHSPQPYHGWVLAFDAQTLALRASWCSTPNGDQGAVWQSGQGITADAEGNLYVMTGNGTVNVGSTGSATPDYSESFAKLDAGTLAVQDFFTPWNWHDLNDGGHGIARDSDLGSAGPVWIPGTSFVIGGGKPGVLYCLDTGHMGGLGDAAHQKNHDLSEVQATRDVPTMAHEPHGTDHAHHIHGSPIVWHRPNGIRVYVWGENDFLKAFSLDSSGKFSPQPIAKSTVVAPAGMPGGMLSLSANGTQSGILWALLPLSGDANWTRNVPGVLRAFDAVTLQQLWNSHDGHGNDPGNFAKFCPPTVANGRVYVPTYNDDGQHGHLVVYGLP
jgi:hypothetical protein